MDELGRLYARLDAENFELSREEDKLCWKPSPCGDFLVDSPYTRNVHNEGAGLQHLALVSEDMFRTLREMRRRSGVGGFEFMPSPPPTYYRNLRKRVRDVLSDEQIKEAEELGILDIAVSFCNDKVLDMVERGNKASIDMDQCLTWLDSKEPNLVIYVCFGGLRVFPESQLVEIGLGLEASDCNFIRVIREGFGDGLAIDDLDDLEEREKGLGTEKRRVRRSKIAEEWKGLNRLIAERWRVEGRSKVKKVIGNNGIHILIFSSRITLRGLTLRSEEIGSFSKEFLSCPSLMERRICGSVSALVGSILLLTPLFSRFVLQLQLQPQEFVTGLAIFSCMPTTLSSRVALTRLAREKFALAPAMTVISNLLGILIGILMTVQVHVTLTFQLALLVDSVA
ncbi:4-hydroxyphenylpyruvate dioxygenase [Camellia lanceoleosa]|uniref:4-hydroxyphenylpyruvate dioxygenase n=1 Tax=Camellia lanceoleosa TaxID=1840588 RepID=A0ACC0G2X8_9ERIC|nr:4-hydroxyphenylpyruvate dioxygenase [Camellia lanceoleosa]